MADLSAVIGAVLQDPQRMAELQNLAEAMGLSGGAMPAASAAPGPAAQPSTKAPPVASPGADGALLQLLMQAAPLLSAAGQEDDAARLLAALRPFLGEARRKKLDEAARILRLMRLLPLLRQSGLLQNFM